ncbi:MAG TPA: ParB/Srx family N-terminal domain-containing protein [Bryobacteraceae bacterium]|nr:ParB/Srx family N-terminal domain-containing protein [Bryobacteraceae bacterium]
MPIRHLTVDVAKLKFDPANPRLDEDEGKDQQHIFRFLVDEIGIDDLLQSISSAGMLEGDPIIVRAAEEKDEYYVIEGNRRLAAIKLLLGEKIADGNPEPAVPTVSKGLAAKLRHIQVQADWEKEALESYLGYKHVTAAREWAPEAKARFVLDRAKQDLTNDNLRKFAKRLGTNLPTLKRWIVAYLTLKQAEKEGIFDPKIAPTRRYFGTFYTLLGSEQVQQFLDLQADPMSENPVPRANKANLSEFLSWVIGTKKDPPVINSRRQKELDVVLSSPKALQHFRLKRDINTALLYTEFKATEIATKLRTAAYSIEDCLVNLFDVREDTAVREAFQELENAYKKARLNLTAKESSTSESRRRS